MKSIFDQTKLGSLNVKNRLVRSATWEDMANLDGSIPDELIDVYENLAAGGVGTIITGFTSVASNDFYFDGMMRLSSDSEKILSQYKKLVEKVHAHDVKILAQLALGGFFENGNLIEPDQISEDQFEKIVELFSDASRRARDCGFDGVQIHAAHFFFLSRFISPAVNPRENRIEILKRILQKIRENAPEFHVSMKLNSNDFTPGGLDENQSMEIAEIMTAEGIDSIEVSGNGTSVAGIRPGKNEGYFFEFARDLSERISIPVILVGGHRSVEHMEKILNSSRIEFLSISRPLICEPNLINRWKSGDLKPSRCVSCNSCYQTQNHQCIFNLN